MKKLTVYIIFISTALIAGYDLIPAFNAVEGDTISEVLSEWAPRWPVVPSVFSVLIGHWFIHPSRVRRPKWGPPVLVLIALLMCLLSILSLYTGGWLYVPAWIPSATMWTLGCTLWKLDKPNA